MTQLGPEARRLILATKKADDPKLSDRARMRERLDASWAHAANAPLTPTASVFAGKLVAGALVLGLCGLGALHLARKHDGAVVPASAVQPTVTPHNAPDVPRLRVAAASADAEQRAPAPASAQLRTELGPAAVPARVRARAARPAGHVAELPSRPQLEAAVVAAQPSPPTAAKIEQPAPVPQQRKPSGPALQQVDDELALLGAAQDALRDGKPSITLQLVREHGFRFPRGALDRERLTVEALALCALARKASARQVLSELARRAPESPALARVRADCGFDAD